MHNLPPVRSITICARETGIKVTEEGGRVTLRFGAQDITLASDQAHLLADALREAATLAVLAAGTAAAGTQAGYGSMPKLFTPATLAKRWGCSNQHIRHLVARNELRGFKIGGKLLRIPGDAVEEFEHRNNLPATDAPGADMPSSPAAPEARTSGGRMDPLTRAKLRRIRQGWKPD